MTKSFSTTGSSRASKCSANVFSSFRCSVIDLFSVILSEYNFLLFRIIFDNVFSSNVFANESHASLLDFAFLT